MAIQKETRRGTVAFLSLDARKPAPFHRFFFSYSRTYLVYNYLALRSMNAGIRPNKHERNDLMRLGQPIPMTLKDYGHDLEQLAAAAVKYNADIQPNPAICFTG